MNNNKTSVQFCLHFWGIQNTQEAYMSINLSSIYQQAIFTSEILQSKVETKTGEKYWKRTRLWHNNQAQKITPDNETIAWQHGCYLHCSSTWKQWDTKLNDGILIISHGSLKVNTAIYCAYWLELPLLRPRYPTKCLGKLKKQKQKHTVSVAWLSMINI